MEEAVGIGIQQESNASIESDNESIEIQMEANTSNENENQNERLVNDLKIMIELSEPLLQIEYRIKKVPVHLRKLNEQAYTPKIISIGPFHHSDVKLQTMEKHKIRYLQSFIARGEKNLGNFVSAVREMEESIHCCYSETIFPYMHSASNDLLKMILVDAIFILELFLRYDSGILASGDPMIAGHWMLSVLKLDLLLLENQLPFFVLEKLFDLAFPVSDSPSLIYLTFRFFEEFNIQNITHENVEIEHFTDLLRTFQLPPTLNPLSPLIRTQEIVKLSYTATQLHEAGVKFKVSSSKCLHDIKFDLKNGVLEIPCLQLYDETEALIRNVMALEQYHNWDKNYVMDYFFFMDFLINTTKDIDLLCNKGVIANYLGDNKAATSVINNLNTNIYPSGFDSNHIRIYKDLNSFYEKPWHRWKATLRHQYFSTPWRTASTIAAVILLGLTFIQTVCSIIQIVPIV